MKEAINNRYDFVFIFDVTDGNPNGDPDAGNLPRIDAETGIGLVTDVCLKRKVRNYVQMAKNEEQGYKIFIKEKAILNTAIDQAVDDAKAEKDKSPSAIMCERYYDVRTFGAVMSTGKNAGQVRGPIQLTFARSVDPINSMEHSITRMAVTKESDANEFGENRTMGRKATVPYGLYLCHGFVSANFAQQSGFSDQDLELFWEAMANMFENDRSAARGMMCARKLIVFKHDSKLGNAPANVLFDLVKVAKNDGVMVPRSYADYMVTIDNNMPSGVTLDVKF